MDQYRKHELPETVRKYKKYTENFQEWLVQTVIQRGVENAARIAEQAKKKYKISTEQQEFLVDSIAETVEPLEDTSGLRALKGKH